MNLIRFCSCCKMERIMRSFILACVVVFVSSCNFPAPQNAVTKTPTLAAPPPWAETHTPAPASTKTVVPPTQTAAPIPCDPLIVDYCIREGYFVFQRPILPPNNAEADITYLYASTQNGKRDPHHGVEFQNAFGTPVHAAGDGLVVFADADKTAKLSPWTNFYGNVVVIQHANATYTLYAHLSNILVVLGQEVNAGDVIGNVGMSGGATGPHLHFEVRMGGDYTDYFSTQNPELWLLPRQGTGALSITVHPLEERNYERPIVVTRYAQNGDEVVFVYYIASYASGFEHNREDAVLNNLPVGRYKIAFNDSSGLRERFVWIEQGKLTEVVFDIK
ncbi:MAG: M23 family metallopeptidase [Chloroflexi bacterium]|nr:M23 family metallopeptidase [Chloroflexota bacterium]